MAKLKDQEVTIDVEPAVEGQIAVREETAVVLAPGRSLASAEARDIRAFMMSQVEHLDVDKMQAFFNLQCQVEDRDAKRLYIAARARLAPNLPVVAKSGRLEYEDKEHKGQKILIAKYAKWEDIERVLTVILAEHGFVMTFPADPRPDGGGLMMRCILSHTAGHSESTQPLPVPLDTSGGKNNIQAYGSSMSYGMRYSARAMGLFRVEGEDDDGVAAGGSPIGQDQAARLVQLVQEAGVAPGPTPEERRAQLKKWFGEVLSYEVTAFTKIRQEDYARLARLLKSLADKAKDTAEQEMRV